MIGTLLEAAKTLVHVVTPLNLAVVSFIEAIFFPIPPDVVLIPLVLMRPEGGLTFAGIATVASVVGALCGYLFGNKGGRPILSRLTSAKRFTQVKELLERYDVWAIAIAGFTPIPYKVFAVAAGVFQISLGRFLLVSLLSRGARFGLIALALMSFGPQMADMLQQHFEWITVGVAVAAVCTVWIYTIVVRRRQTN